MNDGWIGSLGAWDYLTPAPLGFFPGFRRLQSPVGDENLALYQGFENCNFHNFRSGCWIVAKGHDHAWRASDQHTVAEPYMKYLSGLQAGSVVWSEPSGRW